MNTKAQRLVSAIITFLLVSTAVNFIPPAMAQVSLIPNILRTGKMIEAWIVPVCQKHIIPGILNGVFEEFGKNAIKKFLEFLGNNKVSIKPEDKIRIERIRMPNGEVHTVCRLIRNGKEYGDYYMCD